MFAPSGVGIVVAGLDNARLGRAEILALFGVIEHEGAVDWHGMEYHWRDHSGPAAIADT
jgi:hypothetical protein